MSLGRIAIIMAALVCAAVSRVGAEGVSLDRILREHRIYVVTTEKADSISKYILDLQLRNPDVITTTDLLVKSRELKDGQSLLFIMDRSKASRMSSEEERLLPCPTSAIDSSQVILYARKAAGRNAWEMLVSAPNEKWLDWELNRLCSSGLRGVNLVDRGSILDRFLVKRLLIVSTEGRQIAEDWVNGQTKPGADAIDWDFAPVDSWTEGAGSGMDTIFLLDKQKLTDKSTALVAALPKEVQSWLTRDSAGAEVVAAKEAAGESSIQAVVAPSARHLSLALSRYRSIDSIPESLSREQFQDLSGYDQMVLVVRSGDRSADVDENILNDFAGKLTSAISNAGMGFQCVSRQDLKELIYASDGKIDSAQLLSLRKRAGKACALAVADLTAVDAATAYVTNDPERITEPYPEFSTSKPTEPTKPDPEETILFKGKKYRVVDGSRLNDPHYINDLHDYRQNKLPKYRDELRRWERDRDDYEYRRHNHEMEWRLSLDAIQSAKVAGNLRIYDLGGLNTDTAGQVVFSSSLSASAEHKGAYRSDRVTIHGEDSKPGSIEAPESKIGVTDLTVISEALEDACNETVGHISRTAILPSDMLNHKPAPVQNEARYEHVTVQAVGAAKLAQRPTGAAIEDARKAALSDAYSKLIANIRIACPASEVTEGDITDKVSVVSEGWNAQAGEYRVKAKFEGDVAAGEAEVEVSK